MSGKIERIDAESVHRICSGQVVLDLATAVKELVENALDARATQIEIRLRNYGADSIEVIDNGFGVPADGYAGLCLKHHTSKLRNFDDLAQIKSLGFRGEALSSLCALSHLSVVTRTPSDATGTRLNFDANGHITSQQAAARDVGTTVELRSLFHSLPVRLQEFQRSLKREFGKLQTVLQAYAVVSTGVRFSFSHVTLAGTRSTLLGTSARGDSLVDNIADVFTAKICALLRPFELVLPSPHDARLDGFVSRPVHGSGRAVGDRQFWYVNRRPVDLPRFTRIVNDAFRLLDKKQCPMLFLNWTLPTDAYDVNVTPNKREVMIHAERELLDALRTALEAIYQPTEMAFSIASSAAHEQKRGNDAGASAVIAGDGGDEDDDFGPLPPQRVAKRQQQQQQQPTSPPTSQTSRLHSSSCANSQSSASTTTTTATTATTPAKRIGASTSNLDDLLLQSEFAAESVTSSTKRRRRESQQLQRRESAPGSTPSASSGRVAALMLTPPSSPHRQLQPQHDDNPASPAAPTLPLSQCAFATAPQLPPQKLVFVSDAALASGAVGAGNNDTRGDDVAAVVDQPLLLALPTATTAMLAASSSTHDAIGPDVSVDVGGDAEAIVARFLRRSAKKQQTAAATVTTAGAASETTTAPATDAPSFYSRLDASSDKECCQELERVFQKRYFEQMTIVGQFNQGFIIARYGKDVFIVDQHATDEKYNYERLRASTVLQTQRLIAPQRLELAPNEEELLIDHLPIFELSGFVFAVQPEARGGERVQLLGRPFSKATEFGVGDIQEMIALLRDRPGECVRPSRINSMLAMRACRSSVMIGTVLTSAQMHNIVARMAHMQAPWSCPHGRPTMRHLFDISRLLKVALSCE